jgi:hypothetical protein
MWASEAMSDEAVIRARVSSGLDLTCGFIDGGSSGQ